MLDMMRRRLPTVAACAFSTAMMIAATNPAQAWSDEIIKSCTGDYFNYCKQHNPESPELRYCMEAHRSQLSGQCVKALVDAGEVPKKYLVNNPGVMKK